MFSDDFLNYIMDNENARLKVTGTGMRHTSAEGGNDTIGFGHKLTDAEQKSGKVYGLDIANMSVEDAKQIMMYDLSKHRDKAKRQLEKFQEAGKVSKDRSWEDLSEVEQEMLTDFSYNNALHQFPKFTDALVRQDEQGMQDQYKRYTGKKELTGRNTSFANRYFKSPEEVATDVEYDLGTALDPQKAAAIMGDVTGGKYDVNPSQATDGWDLIGDAIRSVRGAFGFADDPKPIRTYEVRSGDTLTSIAQRLGTTPAKLVEDNNITNPNMIKVGQVIEF